MQINNYLFTYGTLMQEFQTPVTDFLKQNTVFIGIAYAKGLLFDLGKYPALVHIPNIEAEVRGNLFKITGDSVDLFKILDDYEGIRERFPTPYEYVRAIIPVQYREQKMESYTYLYNLPINFKKLIPSGNYLDAVDFKLFSVNELMKVRKVV